MDKKRIIADLKYLIRIYADKYGEAVASDEYWNTQFKDKTFSYLSEIVLTLCQNSYNHGKSDSNTTSDE